MARREACSSQSGRYQPTVFSDFGHPRRVILTSTFTSALTSSPAPPASDEKARGRLGALQAHLIAPVFEDPQSRMTLLSGRFSVGFKPLVHLRLHRSRQDKPRALGLFSRRRDRIRQRSAHGTSMHDTFTRDGAHELAAGEAITLNAR